MCDPYGSGSYGHFMKLTKGDTVKVKKPPMLDGKEQWPQCNGRFWAQIVDVDYVAPTSEPNPKGLWLEVSNCCGSMIHRMI